MDAITGYGGIITQCEPNLEAREAGAASVQQQTGASLIPPYNYGPVIAGQGTMGLELLEQVCMCMTLRDTETPPICCQSVHV